MRAFCCTLKGSRTRSPDNRRFSSYIKSAYMAGNSSGMTEWGPSRTKGKIYDQNCWSRAIMVAFTVQCQRSRIPLGCGWHAVVHGGLKPRSFPKSRKHQRADSTFNRWPQHVSFRGIASNHNVSRSMIVNLVKGLQCRDVQFGSVLLA